MTSFLFFVSGLLIGAGVTTIAAWVVGRSMRRDYERRTDDARRAGRLDGIFEVSEEMRAYGITRIGPLPPQPHESLVDDS